jgi:glycerol kinase
MDGFAKTWAMERRFEPQLDSETANRKYVAWKQAVAATLSV